MKLKPFSRRQRPWGRTLIELMISITIGLVIVVAILAVYTSSSSTGRQSEAGTRMSEDAAIALGYMGNYIRMAGFSFPQVNALDNVSTVNGQTVKTAQTNFEKAGIRGCDNGFSNVTTATDASLLACNPTPTGVGGAIAIRFEGDTYNTSPSAGGAPTDCLNTGIATATPSDYDATLSYFKIDSRFYVSQNATSASPELNCRGNGGSAGTAPQPIMQYVESMAFAYGIASDVSSRQINNYLTATQIDALGTVVDQNWLRVLSVRMCIVMRSQVPEQNAGSTYIDCAGNAVASPGGFLRRAFTSVVTLRNRTEFVYTL